jgi:hypothetical protein
MKRIMLGLGLFLAATGTASAQSVEVGEGDWSALPVIEPRGHVQMPPTVLDRLHKLARETDCSVRGFKASLIDLSVPYVIGFTAQGKVDRIVLRDLKCPQLETALGNVLLQMAMAGEYRRSRGTERWYRSELSLRSE